MDIVERLRNLVQPGAECCPDSERLTALIHAGFDAAKEIERLRIVLANIQDHTSDLDSAKALAYEALKLPA